MKSKTADTIGAPWGSYLSRGIGRIVSVFSLGVRILTRSHPVLTPLTPVSRILTHITHTHPNTKINAALSCRAH